MNGLSLEESILYTILQHGVAIGIRKGEPVGDSAAIGIAQGADDAPADGTAVAVLP